MISGMFSENPKTCLTISFTEEYRSAARLSGIFFGIVTQLIGIVRHLFKDRQATFWDLTCFFLVQKGAKTGLLGLVSRYFKGCYTSQHCDHLNHPFNNCLVSDKKFRKPFFYLKANLYVNMRWGKRAKIPL